jgi:hypothetical protein
VIAAAACELARQRVSLGKRQAKVVNVVEWGKDVRAFQASVAKLVAQLAFWCGVCAVVLVADNE